jgi:Calcineurin-like phosphoesterase
MAEKQPQVLDAAHPRKAAKILHISDIHVGAGFNESKWDNLVSAARAIKPDLVMVTGDLVNTPWFWMLARARKRLKALSEALSLDGSACEVWTIPGNHDTRLTGLYPVLWVLQAALVAEIMALLFANWALGQGVGSRARFFLWMGCWGFAGAAVVAIVLRMLTRANLRKIIGDEHYLTAARCSARVPVGILPFDSATKGVGWARGSVIDKNFGQFAELKAAVLQEPSTVWIAAVHHHPLPLPYDHGAESMMAMDNAGAFLSEVSKASIQLVLHGHKHHQHFARIRINSMNAGAAEVAVLSAGTPTKGSNAGAFWHGFNVIHVDSSRRMRVEMFESPPGPSGFELKYSFDIAPLEEQDRRRHLEDIETFGIHCKRLLCFADIEPGGDAYFAREFRGVSTTQPELKALPFGVTARITNGMVEAFGVERLSANGPSMSLVEAGAGNWSVRNGRIAFHDQALKKGDAPIDFVVEFYGNNAFALDRWQHECIYPGITARSEFLKFGVPEKIAVEEFWLLARFPEYGGLPKGVTAIICDENDPHGRHVSADRLVRIESQRLVQLRIPCPLPNAKVELRWDLPEDKIDPTNRDIFRALALRDKLAALRGQTPPQELIDLVSVMELEARTALGAGVNRSYDVALFVFDDASKRLRYLTGTYAASDSRREGEYPFGLGLVGRAFKLKRAVTFDRMKLITKAPSGYVMPHGGGVTSIKGVKENAALAIPLAPPEALDWLYAVLVISTDDPGCPLKLEDTPQDGSIAAYCGTVRALTGRFETIMAS